MATANENVHNHKLKKKKKTENVKNSMNGSFVFGSWFVFLFLMVFFYRCFPKTFILNAQTKTAHTKGNKNFGILRIHMKILFEGEEFTLFYRLKFHHHLWNTDPPCHVSEIDRLKHMIPRTTK